MNRRSFAAATGLLALATLCGCNASFWPGATTKKKADPYDVVTNGMNEKAVVKLLGEPNSRRSVMLEGTGPRAVQLTWVAAHRLITVTFVNGQVIGKQKTT